MLGGLPAGTQWVNVLAIGHAPAGRAVDLRGGDTVSIAVRLGPVPIRLDTIFLVAARRSRDMAEFEERRNSGLGYYLTEDELKRMGSVRGAFYRFPSVRVVGSSRSVFDFRIMFGAGRRLCVANLFIDGVRASFEELAAYRAPDLVGIEVYPRSMGAPHRFQSAASSDCGVVVVWTKYVR